MDVRNLRDCQGGETFESDIVIVGGGAAGLTIAREFFGTPWKVLVLESGDVQETDDHERLNEVEFDSSSVPRSWLERRREYHGHQAARWSVDVQRFGVRCRGLGGSTAAWAGKSAPFSLQDFRHRPWLAFSGWPFDRAYLEPFIRRAEGQLNLGVGAYGDDFWDRFSGKGARPALDRKVFSSFFWQFARSRVNPVNMMRMGPEFLLEAPDNVRVLVNATATCVAPQQEAGVVVDVASLEGVRARVSARYAVVACGALENARLLLSSSTARSPNGLGNERDQVGRYLMDHLNAPVVRFAKEDVKTVCDQFGFFGLSSDKRVDMYMHGLELSADVQERDRLVNIAAYAVADRAEDDPWGAAAALLRGKSKTVLRDIFSIVKAPGMMITGAGRLMLQSDRVPRALKTGIVNMAVRLTPNFVVEEYLTKGIPHKLVGVGFHAIVEQEPLPENRVLLGQTRNRIGQQLPLVKWEPGERSLYTLLRMGELLVEEFPKAGLPTPTPEDWVRNRSIRDAPIIDTAHTSGTTRMSVDPNAGVVDANCRIHGCEAVYVIGASVFPTCGHANPTLMIASLAMRLADHLKERMKAAQTAPERPPESVASAAA